VEELLRHCSTNKIRTRKLANNRWYKGSEPKGMETFLHEKRLQQAEELVQDWLSREIIDLYRDDDIDALAEEIRDLMETGNSRQS